MTDAEMERLCHKALGFELTDAEWPSWMLPWHPLTNDNQAMALVKKFRLWVTDDDFGVRPWRVVSITNADNPVYSDDLNRAIVECIARMQAEK